MTVNKQEEVVTEIVNYNNSVNIVISEPVLKLLSQNKVNINQLFILLALETDAINLLDLYDKKNTDKEVLVLDYQDLYVHEFIQDTSADRLFEISQKGKELIEEVKTYFVTEEKEQEDLKTLCQDYLSVFPKIKLPSGKYARVSSVEIEKKMKSWLKNYKPTLKKEGVKVTSEEILKATRQYVERYAKTGYKFMVTSSYFIQKNEKSALADELLAINQGVGVVKTNITGM